MGIASIDLSLLCAVFGMRAEGLRVSHRTPIVMRGASKRLSGKHFHYRLVALRRTSLG